MTGTQGATTVSKVSALTTNGFVKTTSGTGALTVDTTSASSPMSPRFSSPTTGNEGTTRQLTATVTLDCATTSALLATDVAWSVQSGPLPSISTGGLATAATVYQNTSAVAKGVCSSITGTLNLTVINTNTDDPPAIRAMASTTPGSSNISASTIRSPRPPPIPITTVRTTVSSSSPASARPIPPHASSSIPRPCPASPARRTSSSARASLIAPTPC